MENRDVNDEIKKIDDEIFNFENQLAKLQRKLKELKAKKDELEKQRNLQASLDPASEILYNNTNFPWSTKVKQVLNDTFNLNEFRSVQLQAINATLSKKDLLLLMPTGGGKSLCYQLPSLVENGLTLVVSPLISLIEDQKLSLNKLSVMVKTITSSTSKEDKTIVNNYLSKGVKPTVKLLYVTPEFLNKSKQFKANLQKCHKLGNLNRIAIDEVHCCSQWGHDFRPDYQFLSLLKDMFSGEVPIIGLTATATLSVLVDVQKMLNIRGCLIFKSSFNRKNLFYKVVEKPQNSDSLDYLEDLLKNKFKNKSGIIYALTIKDTEEVSNELRKRGLQVRPYHANLDPDLKTKIHHKWLNNDYQAVVATVAFGMGIDKPDVRFVIHHSLPKSMESLYQESGRAGRDGGKAYCILMYRLADYFRSNSMVNSKVEENKLYSVLQYCLDFYTCRRKQLALHFDEKWEFDDCNKMCDSCKTICTKGTQNITQICKLLYKIIEKSQQLEVNLTLIKLMDAWYKSNEPKPNLDKNQLETTIGYLLLKGFLSCYKSYTAYATHCYIQIGKDRALKSTTVIEMPILSKSAKDVKKRKEVVDLTEEVQECKRKKK